MCNIFTSSSLLLFLPIIQKKNLLVFLCSAPRPLVQLFVSSLCSFSAFALLCLLKFARTFLPWFFSMPLFDGPPSPSQGFVTLFLQVTKGQRRNGVKGQGSSSFYAHAG